MAASPSSVSLTWSGSKSGSNRAIKITLAAGQGNPGYVFETTLSAGGFASDVPIWDKIVETVDAQVQAGTTSGTVSVTTA
jgi:hypothetical protein